MLAPADGPGMMLVPAGHVRDGSAPSLRAPRRVLHRRDARHERQFSPLRRGDRLSPAGRGRDAFPAPPAGRQASRKGEDDHPVVYVSWSRRAGVRRLGRASGCRPRPSGRRRRAAPTDASTRGAGASRARVTPTSARRAAAPCRSARSPAARRRTASSISRATSGSGATTSTIPTFYEDGPRNNPSNLRGGEKARLVMRGGSFMYGSRALRTYAARASRPTTASETAAFAARAPSNEASVRRVAKCRALGAAGRRP